MTQSNSRTPHHLPHSAYIGRIHVSFTACISNGIPVFQNASAVQILIEILGHMAGKHQCQIPVYCFMPEHLHTVITGLQDTSDLWEVMVRFKQQTGYWLRKNFNGNWQKDFYDHVIRHSEDFKRQVYYIVNNPVRRGLVENWQDYPFTGSIGLDLKQVLSEIVESESPSGRAG